MFENLELALKADRSVRASTLFRLNGAQVDRIGEILTLIHLKDSAQRTAGLLSHGQKQWLEIGMLLMQDPKLLLLDEPVAGMTDEETERTAELFLTLEGSHSLVVVEHDMKFIGELTEGKASKKVTVLHEGSVLAEGTLADVQANDKVVEVYLGGAEAPVLTAAPRWRLPEVARGRHAQSRRRQPVLRRLAHPAQRRLRGQGRAR